MSYLLSVAVDASVRDCETGLLDKAGGSCFTLRNDDSERQVTEPASDRESL
jgi:hypothetical protein